MTCSGRPDGPTRSVHDTLQSRQKIQRAEPDETPIESQAIDVPNGGIICLWLKGNHQGEFSTDGDRQPSCQILFYKFQGA